MTRHIRFGNGLATLDLEGGLLSSLTYGDLTVTAAPAPLFTLGLRDKDGSVVLLNASEAQKCTPTDTGARYDFAAGLSVTLTARTSGRSLEWYANVENYSSLLTEWVELPNVTLRPLTGEGGNATILYPYNEGAIVDSLTFREKSIFHHFEPEYPSQGCYGIFPNMVGSQFMSYLFGGHGLYLGAHDTARGVKGIDFYPNGTPEDGVCMQMRLYCGVKRGADWKNDYPVVWQWFDGPWESGADIYRDWFEANLPAGVKKIRDNENLPDWYEDAPVVVTYPVRGIHDMDEMSTNALYPYSRALPRLDDIANRTRSRLLVLLMHWEGTAPWAPPYVWPPLGGEDIFNEFKDALHGRGHMLGVYCSGFGYTMQSNLIAEYNKEEEYKTRALEDAMCVSPAGKVEISSICTAQRSGYDLCPAAPHAREILNEAYRPLLQSGVDYAQILDQNHGGGQYFCYAEDHGHAPAPGPWMTENMQKLLTEWNGIAGKMLLGCESAASEPFIGNLLFSDNRFELCWRIGTPVPLYAYLYHEYLRNFMGNQVACPFPPTLDTLRYRMAYSFAAGDCLTLALYPDGGFYPHWSTRNFSALPNEDKALDFAANLTRFYRESAKPYLYNGRMIAPTPYTVTDAPHYDDARDKFPPVYASAWEQDGKRAQIFVNANETPVTLTLNGQSITVPAMDATMVEI